LYAIGRFALPAMGGILAVLGLLADAQAQTAGAGAAGQPNVRLLAVATPPLADEQLPDGGVVLALVRAGLGRAGPGAASESSVKWTGEALTPKLLQDPSVDLSLPVESADCDRPNNLTQSSAALCDSALFSEPILQVVLSLFTSSTSAFKFDTDQSIFGKIICLSRDHDLSVLNGNGRNWASYKRVTVARRATLLDCVAAVQANDADAFVATDLEGTHLLRRLGLAPYFTLLQRPLATGSIHAVVFRDHARAPDLIATLNNGLKKLKEGDAYASIVQKHLIAAASAPVVSGASAQRKTPPAPPLPPAAKTAAVAAPQVPAPKTAAAATPQAPAPAAVATAPAVAASAPTQAAAAAALPAALPKVDPESRERALKFVKRGGEELAEGRVAPARLLFERAAEMGLAQAAMALAATYDAAELSQPHLRNVLPDPAEARRWYERAHALGAADAGARLQRLVGAK
jgi:Bacterial extracellular solute-binding proteins, family 3